MITYEQLLPEDTLPFDHPFFAYTGLSADDLLFFDIETTGFKTAYSNVYLIGAVYHTSDGWKAIQWMSERVQEEPVLLRVFEAFVKPYPYLVHFNGTRFDIPYLSEKYEQHTLNDPFIQKGSIDIFRDLHCIKSMLHQKNMNQKSLEELIGLYREDPYNGGELIEKYKSFLINNEPSLQKMLLLHNLEDIIGMLRITVLYAYPLLKKQFCSNIPEQCLEAFSLDIISYGEQMIMKTSLPFSCPVPFSAEHERLDTYRLCVSGNCIELSLPILSGCLKYFFPNPKEYYYLPLEDMAIHKSVAEFVSKEYRKRATKENCYIRKEGRFLPHCGDNHVNAFRSSCKSKDEWMELTDTFSSDIELQKILFLTCIKTLLNHT